LEACSLGSTLHTVYVHFTDYVSVDLQLNELNSALDALEQKNDEIHARLIKLLESNCEIRHLFQKNLTDEQKLDPQV
jgi:flagellar basal body-associated protein FliL